MPALSLATGWILGVLAKATAVLLVAWLLTRILAIRRASAASRHFVWALAAGALVLLPVLSAVLPRWEALPRPRAEPIGAAASRDAPMSSLPPVASDPPARSSEPVEVRAPAAVDSRSFSVDPARAVGAVYLAGLIMVLAWAAAGFLAVRRAASRAGPVTDPAWTELMRDVAWELELRRPVSLLRSDASPMPMAWGLWRARILLPAAADAWTPARRRAVLLHETSHVARHDCMTQAVAALACMLYWFHPGVWYAARQLRVERELACDDRVLAAGTRPRNYAADLLEIARAYRAPLVVTPGAVSMARPSQLEGRMLAILDPARSRRAVSRSAAGVSAVMALVAAVPLAAVGPARPEAPRTPSPVAEVAPPADSLPVEARVRTVFGARLDLEAGAPYEVRITGWDRDAVQVRAWAETGSGGPGQVTLSRTVEGARIVAAGTGRPGGARFLEIRVPRRYDVALRGGGSRVDVRGLAGRLTGSTMGGSLALDGVGGSVDVATAGGDASVDRSRLTGRVRTEGGDAAVRENEGDLDVQAGTGAASVAFLDESGRRFPGSVRAVRAVDRVTVAQPRGAILVADAREGVDARTGEGSVEIHGAGGDIFARTGRGAVTVRDARHAVDVSTGAGSVVVEMVESRDATVETHSGAVTLVLPRDFRGTIEAAATSTDGRPVQVRSEFPLRAQDARPGLRRAAGSFGGGERARVIVSATNGDVVIRRASSP